MQEVVIRPWRREDSAEEITEVLHLAYGALARQGMHYNASHQPPSQTLARLEAGDSFVVVTETGRIVGTISVYQSSVDHRQPYYARPGLVYFGQFGVHPDFQRLGIAKRMYQVVEQHAQSRGANEIALDTAETAYDLIATYRRWGFAIVDSADWDSTNYISVIMAKSI